MPTLARAGSGRSTWLCWGWASRPRRAVAREKQALASERGQTHHHICLVLGAPAGELVCGLDGCDQAEVRPTLLDGGDVDLQVMPYPVRDDGVTGLVDGDGVALPF